MALELVQGGQQGAVGKRYTAFDPTTAGQAVTMPSWLLRRVEVSLAAKVVYAALTGYFNSTTGLAAASHAELAQDTGLAPAQVVRAMTELRNDGLLWRVEGIGTAARYRFLKREWMEVTFAPADLLVDDD